MKKILLIVESVLLLVPITCVLCYTSILTLIIGLPASIMSAFNPGSADGLFIVLASLGNIAGAYAIIILWLLVGSTIKEKVFLFSRRFKAGIICGVFASLALVYIYGLWALALGVAPPVIAALHFVYLQMHMQKNA